MLVPENNVNPQRLQKSAYPNKIVRTCGTGKYRYNDCHGVKIPPKYIKGGLFYGTF